MLWFYSIVSTFFFLLVGNLCINKALKEQNKNVQTSGAIFMGLGSLGLFCMLIQLFVFTRPY